ncbi:MAG: hypothetical protein JSR53_01490 [Proteobacteria bacterium]|nr:hypothetical protein [Pseudomonadota bacterium]
MSMTGAAVLVAGCGGGGGGPAPMPPVPAPPPQPPTPPPGAVFGAEQVAFLLSLEQGIAQFFWNMGATPWTGSAAGPARGSASGLIADKADAGTGLPHGGGAASIVGTGFGLAALCIVASRLGTAQELRLIRGDGSQVSAGDLRDRVYATLSAIAQCAGASGNGLYYHYVDSASGQATGSGDIVSTGDNALLQAGIMVARQFYASDPAIHALASRLMGAANWSWMMNGNSAYELGWSAGGGFSGHLWGAYSAVILPLLLGLGSPDAGHRIAANPRPSAPDARYPWDAILRPVYTCGSYPHNANANYSFAGCPAVSYIGCPAPLFAHQYPQAFFRLQGRRDAYADYFQNSALATQACQAWCVASANQLGFVDSQSGQPYVSSTLWGLTASSSNVGGVPTYEVWGGPPASWPANSDPWDGTLVPCAAGGSLPFMPQACVQALQNMRAQYPLSWPQFQSGPYQGQSYGFVDAFNPAARPQWYSSQYLSIDMGITLLMAENALSGFVWNLFMGNPEAGSAMQAAGLA